MKATVKWIDEMVFMGETESGNRLAMEAVCVEEKGKSINPLELILQSVGACSSSDVVSMLKKARQQIEDVTIKIDAERADTIPRVFTKIKLHFTITGKEIRESSVKRAIGLSMDKYCSVAAMLRASVEIEHSYEIINT